MKDAFFLERKNDMNAVEAFDEIMRLTNLENEYQHAYETDLRVERYTLNEKNPDAFLALWYDLNESWIQDEQEKIKKQGYFRRLWYEFTNTQPVFLPQPQKKIVTFFPKLSFFPSTHEQKNHLMNHLKQFQNIRCFIFEHGELKEIERNFFLEKLDRMIVIKTHY